MQKVVFVDRDGVINEMVYFKEHGFVDSPFTESQFKIINGVTEAIKLFHSMGFKVIIISNQPGIAKKHFTLETFELMKNKLHLYLKKNKTFIDDEFYCLHHPDAKLKKYKKICDCRKPRTGLIKSAVKKYNIDLKNLELLRDSTDFYLNEHNKIIPHSFLKGATPIEVYTGKWDEIEIYIKSQLKKAKNERQFFNNSMKCSKC